MPFFLLALVTSILGIAPLLIARSFGAAVIAGVVELLLSWWVYYMVVPSFVWPLWGMAGAFVVICWVISAIMIIKEEALYYVVIAPIVGILVFAVSGFIGWGAFNAKEYANLIGEVETRGWVNDFQPADPRHVRLVSSEFAGWQADKQLGEVPGAIGSQFEVVKDYLTIQLIRGELWYVAPLDYKGFAVWTSVEGAPGYVMVHGEDPMRPARVITGYKFQYMPGAWFDKNLERHLWSNGYASKGLTDYTFEIDEEGNPWWVVTVFEPTIKWWGLKATGVVVVNPTTGEHKFYPIGQVPKWIDRVVPDQFVEDYVYNRGVYHAGWLNSWWAKKNLMKPEQPTIVYGSDGEPYWVTSVTSTTEKEESRVGLYYTHARTGKSVFYRAVGGTEKAVLKSVDNKVKFKNFHGSGPVLYNIYGTMADVVPILGENKTFQGVAIVGIENLQVAEGRDSHEAFREYQKIVAKSGQQVTPELGRQQKKLSGIVDRIAYDLKGGVTTYYFHLTGVAHLFSGGSELSPKLPVTKVGDKVMVTFIDSREDVVPLLSFDNLSLELLSTPAQLEMREKVERRKEEITTHREARPAHEELQKLSDKELQELLELKRQKK